MRRELLIALCILVFAAPMSVAQIQPYDPDSSTGCQACSVDRTSNTVTCDAIEPHEYGGSAWNPCQPTTVCFWMATDQGYQVQCNPSCGGTRCGWA